jgi:hypothetical protein
LGTRTRIRRNSAYAAITLTAVTVSRIRMFSVFALIAVSTLPMKPVFPANMKNKGLRFKVIAQEAIDWYTEHGWKDVKSFRIRMNIILKDFGDRIADEIKPSDAWLSAHKCAPAAKNRYKTYSGETFANGKVTSNPSTACGAEAGK